MHPVDMSDKFKIPFTTTSDFFFVCGILLGVYAKYLNPIGFDEEIIPGYQELVRTLPALTHPLCTHDLSPFHPAESNDTLQDKTSRSAYVSLVQYRPMIFKFVMLPTIVFSGSFNANSRSMFLEFFQTLCFGVIGKRLSVE